MFEEYPDMLTVHQIAQILRIGRNKAYALVNSGDINSLRIGRKHLVPKVWLIDFIEGLRYNKSA